MTKKDAFTSSRTAHPLITLENCSRFAGQPALRAARAFTPIKIPGSHFCERLSGPQGLVRLEGLDQLKICSRYLKWVHDVTNISSSVA
jgi:hypothetical protein